MITRAREAWHRLSLCTILDVEPVHVSYSIASSTWRETATNKPTACGSCARSFGMVREGKGYNVYNSRPRTTYSQVGCIVYR